MRGGTDAADAGRLQPEDADFCGEELSKEQKLARFGSSNRGVLKRDSGLHLKLITGLSSVYPNAVDGTTVRYCHAPPGDNALISSARDSASPVRVLVTVNVKNYDFGWFSVTGSEKHAVRGREYDRWVLKRRAVQPGAPAVGATGGRCETPAKRAAVDAKGGLCETPAKRPAVSVWVDNAVLDSILEFRHTVLAKELGLTYEAQDVGAFHLGDFGAYNPDAILRDVLLFENADATSMCYVEIKPRYPQEPALRKCERLAEKHGHPVLLMYGNMRQPFDRGNKRSKNEMPSYAHANGLRSMLFTPKGNFDGLVWMWDTEQSRARLAFRRKVADMRWAHDKVSNAFLKAAAADVPTCRRAARE